jgi:hypothetical protein
MHFRASLKLDAGQRPLYWAGNTVQNDDRYVPGGYITYIVMEKAEGINLESFEGLPREERDQIREAFISAWR